MLGKLPRGMRPAIVVCAVFLLFLITLLIVSALMPNKDPALAPDITGVTADGKTLRSLYDLPEEKGTLLIFFDCRSKHAVKAMKLIGEIAPDYDVNLMAVSETGGEIKAQLASMKELEIPLAEHTVFDVKGEMAKIYNVKNTPVIYFIDKNKEVEEAFIAAISEKSLKKCLKKIA